MSEVGRPKTPFDLTKGWQDNILGLYKSGASDVEIKAEVYSMRGSFSNDLWDRWMKEEEEFSETIKVGKVLSEAWWHRSGRKNLDNKEFNFTGWYMNMKNRFGWADKQEVDHTTKGQSLNGKDLSKLTDEELRQMAIIEGKLHA